MIVVAPRNTGKQPFLDIVGSILADIVAIRVGRMVVWIRHETFQLIIERVIFAGHVITRCQEYHRNVLTLIPLTRVRPAVVLVPSESGRLWRVVVVVDSRTSVEGYDIEQWASHLKRGVLVEITNPSGVHLVHHADLD
jgi:hypothetical protein